MVGREVWVWEGLAESEREEQVRAGKEQQREESSRRTHGEKTEPDFAIPRSRPSLIRLALRPSTLPLRLPRLGAGMRATRIAIVVDRKILQ